MNKKGIFSLHPILLSGIFFVLGLIVAYLMAKGIIPIGTGLFCPAG